LASSAGDDVSSAIPLDRSRSFVCAATATGSLDACAFGSMNRSSEERYSGFTSIRPDSRAFWEISRDRSSSSRSIV
jgi:hypothetical protein